MSNSEDTRPYECDGLAAYRQVPLVPCCAGTGLSGGASPIADGVVQPGVRNLAISDAAAAHGLYYAPDPSSQIACTIGGNVAENSGGEHCTEVRADLL